MDLPAAIQEGREPGGAGAVPAGKKHERGGGDGVLQTDLQAANRDEHAENGSTAAIERADQGQMEAEERVYLPDEERILHVPERGPDSQHGGSNGESTTGGKRGAGHQHVQIRQGHRADGGERKRDQAVQRDTLDERHAGWNGNTSARWKTRSGTAYKGCSSSRPRRYASTCRRMESS